MKTKTSKSAVIFDSLLFISSYHQSLPKWLLNSFFLFLSQLLLHGRSYLLFSQSIMLASSWLSYLKFFFHLVQLLKAKRTIFYPGLELCKLAILYLLKLFSSLAFRLRNSSAPSPVTAPSYFHSLALFTFHFNCTKIPLLYYVIYSSPYIVSPFTWLQPLPICWQHPPLHFQSWHLTQAHPISIYLLSTLYFP